MTHVVTRLVVQFQFRNSVGDWCPRFERRTSSLLGQSLGLFASTSFKAGELVTVFCGRRQKPNTTPFCIESIYYQAKLRCGRQLIVVDAAGCGELLGAHFINCATKATASNVELMEDGVVNAAVCDIKVRPERGLGSAVPVRLRLPACDEFADTILLCSFIVQQAGDELLFDDYGDEYELGKPNCIPVGASSHGRERLTAGTRAPSDGGRWTC